MSPEGIKFLVLGLIPLAFFTLWLRAEIKTASPGVRVGSGIVAGISLCLWMLSLTNSLGSYYDGMREHRLLESLIRSYPGKATEIEAWASNYQFYRDFEHHVTRRRELEAITE